MFGFSNPVIDLNGLKEMTTNHGGFLKSQIDSCHIGQIVTLSTRLPRHCTPGQAEMCFVNKKSPKSEGKFPSFVLGIPQFRKVA